jgi:hypothetical protein
MEARPVFNFHSSIFSWSTREQKSECRTRDLHAVPPAFGANNITTNGEWITIEQETTPFPKPPCEF